MDTLFTEKRNGRFWSYEHSRTEDVAPSKVREFYARYCEQPSPHGEMIDRFGSVPLFSLITFRFVSRVKDTRETFPKEFLDRLGQVFKDVIFTHADDGPLTDDNVKIVIAGWPHSIEETPGRHTVQLRLQSPGIKADSIHLVEKFNEKFIARLSENVDLYRLVDFTGQWSEMVRVERHRMPLFGAQVAENIPREVILETYGNLTLHPTKHSMIRKPIPLDEGLLWPVFLSMGYGDDAECVRITSFSFTDDEDAETFSADLSSDDDKFSVFLSMINPERFDRRRSWLIIGAVCRSLDPKQGLGRWTELTLQYSKVFTERDCRLQYKTLSNSITIKSLAWMASIDSPGRFSLLMRNWWKKAMPGRHNPSVTFSDAAVATIFYRRNWLRYVWSEGHWYHFCETHWEEIEPPLVLRELRYQLNDELRIALDDLEQDEDGTNGTVHKTVKNFMRAINSNGASHGILRMCTSFFAVNKLRERFDGNPNLFVLKNTTIYCGSDAIEIGESFPEDYVVTYSESVYEECSWEDEGVRQFMHWMDKLFPRKDTRDFVLKMIAASMGVSVYKMLPVLISAGIKKGNEGKSKFINFLEMIFGRYMYTTNPMMFCRRSDSGSANQDLVECRGKKIIIAMEPSLDLLDGAFMKQFTGNDTINARGVFGRNCDRFKVTGLLMFVCNEMPSYKNADGPIQERTKFIPMTTRFSKDAPEDPEDQRRLNHYVADPFFEEKMPAMVSPAIWVLTQYYRQYLKEGLAVPEEVQNYTQEYWADNDPLAEFVRTVLMKVEDGEIYKPVRVCNVLKQWKAWCRQNPSCQMKVHGTKQFAEMLLAHQGIEFHIEGGIYHLKGWVIQPEYED